MSSMKPKSPDVQLSELRAFLVSIGEVVPTSEAEVMLYGRSMDLDAPELPESLMDLDAIYAVGSGVSSTRAFSVGPRAASGDQTRSHFARAAREGGDISSEVEARMKKDREEAEARVAEDE